MNSKVETPEKTEGEDGYGNRMTQELKDMPKTTPTDP